MALTTVKACPNNTQTWSPVRVLCGSSVLFHILLPPFDSAFLSLLSLSSLFSCLPAWSLSLFSQWQLQKFHTDGFYLSCSSVCSTGHRKSIWTGGKPSLFLSSYFSHLINSTLSTTRALVSKKAWTWMPSSLPFYVQATFIFDKHLNLSQSGFFAI